MTDASSHLELEITSLLELICTNFPAEKFVGMITPVDGKFTEDLDEEKDLYDTLQNLKWPEIPATFIRANPDGFVLLTDAACVSFLPAWLVQALEDPNKKNRVREFVIYAVSPDQNTAPLVTSYIVKPLRRMNPAQRTTLRSVLEHLVKYEPSKYIKNDAERAVAFLEAFERQLGKTA